jgi:multidrug efflux system outer membrane protein
MRRHQTYRTIYIVLAAAIAAVGGSCGVVFRPGPDYERPAGEIPTRHTYAWQPDTAAALPATRWWEVFGDTTLNRLVVEAFRNNLDIRKATASVAEMRARSRQALADRLPAVTAQGTWQKQELPESSVIPGQPTSTEQYNLSLAASYEVDLWGKVSRSREAALADLAASEESRRAIVQSVIAETATLYLQMEALERRVQIAEDLVGNYGRSVATIEGRYRRGLTSVLDLKQAQRGLASARSVLPQLRQELGVTQHRLSVLLGRYPESAPPRQQPEDYFTRLAPVPAGLPSDLLSSRPDVRAAEERLRALNARYGVAAGNLFPRITLTGSYGYRSPELRDIFTPQNVLWNVLAGITQPIFNSQTLLAETGAARARYEQGVADYARTVLGAFAEVENALLTRERQLERREYVIDFLEKARATLDIAQNRYDRGLVSYITVLDAWSARYRAEDDLVLVDLAILTNRVALHRALGGEWLEPEQTELERR